MEIVQNLLWFLCTLGNAGTVVQQRISCPVLHSDALYLVECYAVLAKVCTPFTDFTCRTFLECNH